MPGLDGTGPRGEGSNSGRGLGRCHSTNNKINDREHMNGYKSQRGLGRGCGRGFGGRGFRRNWEMAPIEERS